MLEEFLESITGERSVSQYWIVEVFIIVLLTLIGAYIARVLINKLHAKADITKTLWDDALLGALRKPVNWLIWLIGLSVAADIVGRVSLPELLLVVEKLRAVGIIVLIAWFSVSLVRNAEENLVDPVYTNNKPMDETTVRAIGKLLRVTIIITSGLVALESFGYSVSGVLAFGGIGGLAVGFAAKDMLANFFGGLMVYLDRQFAVGDWVRSPDKNIEGTVEDIGWRLTRIRTFDKRPLYVPNSTFTQIAVENPSRMTNRRIYETIGVRYEDAQKLPAIVDEVKTMLYDNDAIDTSQTLMVNFNAFASSSLDFFIYTFTKTTNWAEFHQIKQDVLFKILKIIEAHGAECAFPTSTVHLPDAPAMIDAVSHKTNANGEQS